MHIRWHRFLFPLTLSALLPAALPAQPVPYPTAPPANGTAPLLYVRFLGPKGMVVLFFRGADQPSANRVPVTVGMRPGYIYRVEMAELPNHPGVSLFPTIEVIGTLRLPPKISARSFPAPVVLTEDDIDIALAGGMVTKVVYLEHPEKGLPGMGNPDDPVETPLPGTQDMLRETREIGRPMLIVRVGGREVSQEDMAQQGLPGTVLLPGEASLPLPRFPPVIAPVTWQWYDPLLGPPHPEEEYVHNGGLNPNRGETNRKVMDRATLPGIDHDGRLQGMRSEDAVAEYTSPAGQRSVVLSNRVCLAVPRYGIFRQEEPLDEFANVTGVADHHIVNRHDAVRSRQPLGAAIGKETLSGMKGRSRAFGESGTTRLLPLVRFEVLEGNQIYLGPGEALGTRDVQLLTDVERTRLARKIALARSLSLEKVVSGFSQVVGSSIVARLNAGPELVRATAETRDVTAICLKEPPHAPDKPLVLIKWADRESAKVGDVVTFFLRYSAQGSKPLTEVAVTDSLSSRLEYIPGSAQSNRAAVFTVADNEVGSQVLRWEVSGKLFPGETGVVRFQAKVR